MNVGCPVDRFQKREGTVQWELVLKGSDVKNREGFPILQSEQWKTLIWQRDLGRVFQAEGSVCRKVLWQEKACKELEEVWLCSGETGEIGRVCATRIGESILFQSQF